ncbi:MAG: hypothetical protein N4A44_02595 [Alphaproteobacteria bacterium]|jgi:hypothetical protein|nr:hypothetical protein [Alphaproteobacteria bacterium]
MKTKTIKHKKRRSILHKKSSTNIFISENLDIISMLILLLISLSNIGYTSQLIKELFIIPFFYFSFNEDKKISFSEILVIALLKDLSEISYVGLNIFILISINFFLHFQSSIKFDSSTSTILTMIGATFFILFKSLILLLMDYPLHLQSIFHTILLSIVLTPAIIKTIKKTKDLVGR